jgi:stage III sporulation protein SpoIIIAA
MNQKHITDDLDALLAILPSNVRAAVEESNDSDNLLEIVLDLGRVPTARYVDREFILAEDEVTREDLDAIISNIGDFDADNRAGMERTLHRISAIRNRRGAVVGLTCRVGRAVYGTIEIIQDLIESGQSILMLGRPASARPPFCVRPPASSRKRSASSSWIRPTRSAGTGMCRIPLIGKARRMQVS